VVRAAKGVPVKVILETGFLDAEQIYQASRACVQGEATFVKTSTGFGPRGASLEDIAIMRRALEGSPLKIKASGGIRSYADWKQFAQAGASRIGTSASVEIVKASRGA